MTNPTPAASALQPGAPKVPGPHTPEGQQKSFAELVTRVASIGAQAFNRVRAGRVQQPNAAYPELISRFASSPVGESVQRVATQAWQYVPPKAKPWVMIGVGALNVALMVYEGYDQHRHPKSGATPGTAKAGPDVSVVKTAERQPVAPSA